jgi:hypothetical protein
MSTSNRRSELITRLRARSKAWADLHEIASHIGVFPLDCCMIDSRLEAEAADELEHQHYADIEHEHLGCPVAETGIYAPRFAEQSINAELLEALEDLLVFAKPHFSDETQRIVTEKAQSAIKKARGE